MGLEVFFEVYRDLFGQIGIACLYALSIYIVLAAGQLSLAQAGFGAISAYTAVLLITEQGFAAPVAITVGIAAATLAAGILALPLLRLRGVFLAIATIGFGEVVRVTLNNLEITGGASGLTGNLPKVEVWHIYAVLGMCGFLLARLAPTGLGRSLSAVREDETAAQMQGINVRSVRLIAFLISGALAGTAGALEANFGFFIGPAQFGEQRAIEILTFAVIGGVTIWYGPLIGAALLTLLPTLLRDSGVDEGWVRLVLQGTILLLVILFLPDGLASLLPRRRQKVPAPSDDHIATQPLELRTESVSRHFGGVTALHDVSVHLRPGRVLGLVGPNGAGKTTLVNAITGIVPPSSGRVLIDGQDVTNMPAWQLSRRGVARTFQNLRVFTHLSALDNVLAGTVRRLPRTYFSRLLFLPHARKQEHEQAARAVTLLDLVGLAGKEAVRGDQLSYGDQRRLEIARALASNPGLVILDEPAAGMNANEAARLVGLIRRIAETGRSVVLIEHNMSVVMKASDDVAVLNFGEVIGQGTPDQIKTAPAVVEAYLGA